MGVIGFWTDAVKIDLYVSECLMISMRLGLQSDHEGRLQSTTEVRVVL